MTENGTSSSEIPHSNWTKEQLMVTNPNDKVAPALWGRPGHLTAEETSTYLKFKETVELRGGDFKDTLYCFGEEEGEVYALCRWLRARKFVLQDVMIMLEEAIKCSAEAKKFKFYPEPATALGCDEAIYNAQYPQVYSGFAKNGSPLFISKVGVLNIDAVECITTVTNIVKYHWYVQMHDYARRLRAHKKIDPNFTRFECVCVLDLANLTVGQLNSRTLKILKDQMEIDSLCFPETLNKMYLINCPSFFAVTWKMIKNWIDPRTSDKVEVLSSRKTWEKALLEYVDEEQLPSDYGGKGPITKDTMEKEGFTGNLKRLHTEVLYLRTSGSVTYDIYPGEELEIAVYTRSNSGAKFSVSSGKTTFVGDVEAKHIGEDFEILPTKVQLTKTKIKGPDSIKVKADSMGSRFTRSTSNFLVVLSVYDA
mmetsp:Transcript_25173/g.53669  ORF Transcript_25173/g.53669 Transcript_25173/m.53669 type:complete len:423 (+) Transcript_25173:220-1488(+)